MAEPSEPDSGRTGAARIAPTRTGDDGANAAHTRAAAADAPPAGRLRRLHEILREIDPEMTVQTFATLVEVALGPGISVQQVADALGIAQSSGTRNADLLGSHGRGNKAGVGLVERRASAGDRRIKELHLTPRGRRVVARLVAALD